ncbi:MAG: carboxymuconolactone decarboxylase family protein [Acidimicrobiales bacterium]
MRDTWSERDGPTALADLAPEAAAALDRALAAGTLPAAAAVPGRVLGLPPLVAETPQHPLITSFAEQFAADVTGIDDLMRAELAEAAGDRQFAVVMAIYLGDWVPRVRHALDALFARGQWQAVEPGDGDRWAAIDELQRVVARLDALDPVTTELVRLRGARQHQCRLCQSLRSRSALVAGADDATFAAVDDFADSDLPAAQKAALALTDALIWTPADLPADVLADVRKHVTPTQAVELVLDVMRNAGNKIAVALGADAPNVDGGVEVYDINADGTLTYGLIAP